jgi:hypothetical protein
MGGEGEKAKLRLSTTFASWQDCPPVTPHSCADALQRNYQKRLLVRSDDLRGRLFARLSTDGG